ncbi:hypothetical protein EON66_00650 [archaeon]|nr:MAG: hypothetical protein EON66_00650 [archaeon]
MVSMRPVPTCEHTDNTATSVHAVGLLQNECSVPLEWVWQPLRRPSPSMLLRTTLSRFNDDMATVVVYDERFAAHLSWPPTYFESGSRASAIFHALRGAGMLHPSVTRFISSTQPASTHALLTVHPPEHIHRVEATDARPLGDDAACVTPLLGRVLSGNIPAAALTADWMEQVIDIYDWTLSKEGDTYACPATAQVARLAAGAAITAVDEVVSGAAVNAFAVVRPPGHHCASHRTGGFCFYSNVAIAARHAQDKYGIQRVAIVDFDVHHGSWRCKRNAAAASVQVCTLLQMRAALRSPAPAPDAHPMCGVQVTARRIFLRTTRLCCSSRCTCTRTVTSTPKRAKRARLARDQARDTASTFPGPPTTWAARSMPLPSSTWCCLCSVNSTRSSSWCPPALTRQRARPLPTCTSCRKATGRVLHRRPCFHCPSACSSGDCGRCAGAPGHACVCVCVWLCGAGT